MLDQEYDELKNFIVILFNYPTNSLLSFIALSIQYCLPSSLNS